jgi:hypothetical protein
LHWYFAISAMLLVSACTYFTLSVFGSRTGGVSGHGFCASSRPTLPRGSARDGGWSSVDMRERISYMMRRLIVEIWTGQHGIR